MSWAWAWSCADDVVSVRVIAMKKTAKGETSVEIKAAGIARLRQLQ
jgi:hypothetical protein